MNIFRRFYRFLKRKKHVKRKKERDQIRTLTSHLSLLSFFSPFSLPFSPWSFHDGTVQLNFYSVDENKSLTIIKL